MNEETSNKEIRKESCKTCRFYQAVGDRNGTPFGECRKNTPVIAIAGSQWPKVAEYAWCGEWRPTSSN